jgi:hypothetical protein
MVTTGQPGKNAAVSWGKLPHNHTFLDVISDVNTSRKHLTPLLPEKSDLQIARPY